MTRLLTLCVLAAASVLVSGCGFTPLYGTPSVNQTLASIDVVAPKGRIGELIREHLDDTLGHRPTATPDYRMTLALGEQRYARGVRVDNVATRYEYVLTASYRLEDTKTQKVAKTGRVRVEVTYDSADQPYASVAAQQDAEDRAANEAARRINLELAAWLVYPPPKPVPKPKPQPTPAS